MSKTEAVAQVFRARPGEWISAIDLTKAGGLLSWRTRISDLRKPPYSMQIENRTERHPAYGTVSFYRFTDA